MDRDEIIALLPAHVADAMRSRKRFTLDASMCDPVFNGVLCNIAIKMMIEKKASTIKRK